MKITEAINENTQNLDLKSTQELLEIFINEEDAVTKALEQAKYQIAGVIDQIFLRIKDYREIYQSYTGNEQYTGPRIFYFGAGTSGRLAILDASECPPTFSSHPDMFNAVIAGGNRAITQAIENAEDNSAEARSYVEQHCGPKDIVIGISANGAAPFVKGAIDAARDKGLYTVAIANNRDAEIFKTAQEVIYLDTGAEIITGSTRLKAGTAQKIVLNMISSSLMIKVGKVYDNLMVDLQAKNKKLKQRAMHLVQRITGVQDEKKITTVLQECSYKVKVAILMLEKNVNAAEAQRLLEINANNLRESLIKGINSFI
jgi:N-acetylmuramic acid 6-phosphate etherase